jgi:hypothetical protein
MAIADLAKLECEAGFMDEAPEKPKNQDEMPEEEKRANVIRFGFGGDIRRFQEFCDLLRNELPEGTGAVLRGSAVTGIRYDDGAPFDADGPGTSDLDLTLLGEDVIGMYILDGFYVPKIHSKPLSDKDPDIAPKLIPLRRRLQAIAGRPVNIQASRDFVLFLRGDLMGQPYLTLIEKVDAV